MLTDILWPDESQFCIDKVEMENETIMMSITATNEKGICPRCVESYYTQYMWSIIFKCAMSFTMPSWRR